MIQCNHTNKQFTLDNMNYYFCFVELSSPAAFSSFYPECTTESFKQTLYCKYTILPKVLASNERFDYFSNFHEYKS